MMWTSFRNGVENHGQSKYMGLVSNRRLMKRLYIGGIFWGTAVIDDENNVYVGSSNRLFVCINSQGEIKWKYKLDRLPDSLVDSAAVLHPAGLIIVPGGDGTLHGLEKETGKLVWRFSPKEQTEDIPKGAIVNSFEGNIQIDKRGWIYVGCDNGFFYCINGATGMLLWSFKTNMMIWSCACLIKDEKYVIFGSLDWHIYMIDVETGSLVSKYKTNAEIKSSPLTFDNIVIICNTNGTIYCFDVTQNKFEMLWMHDFEAEIYSSPAYKDGMLVFAKMNGDIEVIDLETRQKKWGYRTGSPICSSPIITKNNIIFVGAADGKLYAFDLQYNRLLGYYDTTVFYKDKDKHYRKNLNASPAMDANSVIHIGSYDGYLYSIPSYCCVMSQNLHANPQDDSMVEHVYDLIVKQFKFDIEGVPNAAISALYTQKDIPYKIIISSDGKYVNFIPKTVYGLDKEYNIEIKGKYYLQSSRWWKDRINFQEKNFSEKITLPALDYKSTLIEKMKENSIIRWDMWDFFSTQPRVLDTYIPAAMNAIGFTAFAFGFEDKVGDPRKFFKMILLPSLPACEEGEKFLFSHDRDKVLLIDAYYFNGFIFTDCKNNFELSVMGGTLPFHTFQTFMKVNDDYSLSCDYYCVASCLSIKGNGEDYQFSPEIVNQLCNPMLNVISVGSFKGKYTSISDIDDDIGEVFIQADFFTVVLKDHVSQKMNIISIVEYNQSDSKLYVYESKMNLERYKYHKIKGYRYVIFINDVLLSLLSEICDAACE